MTFPNDPSADALQTFFGTDVVKYPNQGANSFNASISAVESSDGTSFSNLALKRWLQVTLPLTCTTLGIAYFFYRRAAKTFKTLSGMREKLPYYTKEVV